MNFEDSSLRWALTYAHMGFAILPTDNQMQAAYARRRFPPDPQWPSRPTSDPATIAGWYLRAPYAGVALALQPSSMLAIIFDGIEGAATLEALIDKHGWSPWETASLEAGEAR